MSRLNATQTTFASGSTQLGKKPIHGRRWRRTAATVFLSLDRLTRTKAAAYVRDGLAFGVSYYMGGGDSLAETRLYAEADVSLNTMGGAEPWEFQFGVDYAPLYPTGLCGAPFAAANIHLREEVNFGGNFTGQIGWAWRGEKSGSLFRIGLHYFNGESSQFSFVDEFEQQFGFGIWYDR